MWPKFIAVAAFVLLGVVYCTAQDEVVAAENGLECYTCSSDKNHPDYTANCHDHELSVDNLKRTKCTGDDNACFKFIATHEQIKYSEKALVGHITSRMCGVVKKKRGQSELDLEDCEEQDAASGMTTVCHCGGSLCNAGDFIKASVLSVVAASLLSLLML